MQITWLGQAGFLVETQDHLKIMIDPYLSNSLEETAGAAFRRQVPIDERFLSEEIDVLVLSHGHGDHTDYQTLDKLLATERKVEILCTVSTYAELRKRYGKQHNYIQCEPGVCVTVRNTAFHAVKAIHTDREAIGILIENGGKTLYHTGDTLYAPSAAAELPLSIDYLLCPINGWGGNMNMQDAAKLVRQLKPKYTCPMHWDLFLPPWGCAVKVFLGLFSEEEQARICVMKQYQPMILPE